MSNEYLRQSEKTVLPDDHPKIVIKELYRNHYHDLYYYAIKISGKVELSKDCIQDMFLQFWSDYSILNRVKYTKPYMLKCLRRRIYMQIGKEKKKQTYSEEIAQNSNGSVEENIIRNENEFIRQQYLAEAIHELTLRQKEALYLRYKLGYKYEMICDIMDIKYQSARNLINEAIKSLKIRMVPEKTT